MMLPSLSNALNRVELQVPSKNTTTFLQQGIEGIELNCKSTIDNQVIRLLSNSTSPLDNQVTGFLHQGIEFQVHYTTSFISSFRCTCKLVNTTIKKPSNTINYLMKSDVVPIDELLILIVPISRICRRTRLKTTTMVPDVKLIT
ncbi:hypothetical protein L1887_36114 [Cichorium endivia]|nr:hypothetical protein L1887_36114 [Cichorium endivia]